MGPRDKQTKTLIAAVQLKANKNPAENLVISGSTKVKRKWISKEAMALIRFTRIGTWLRYRLT